MVEKSLYYLLGSFLCLYILQGDIYSQNKPDSRDLIHFGDIIDVDVVGSTEYDWRGTLNPEGFLNGIDYVSEPIYGLCKSEEEISAEIAKGYSKLLRNPQVVVKILDRSNRPISFLNGAVKKKQRFLIKRDVTLNELIILAGGITEKASGEIQIIRPQNLSCRATEKTEDIQKAEAGKSSETFINVKKDNAARLLNIKISDLLKGEKSANPIILNGDIINVLEAEPIYVIGGVINPKQINARSQMTVSRAVASAGGFSKDANPKNVSVFRRENGETKIIDVDFEKMKTAEAEDIVLQKYDIVDVGQTGRGKREFPPIIKVNDINPTISAEIPLKIID